MLQGEAKYDRHDAAQAADVSLDAARKIWRAMGFADVGEVRAFAETDLRALWTIGHMINSGVLSLEDAIEIVRSLGQTTSRLAEWQADTFSRIMQRRGIIQTTESLTQQEVEAVYEEAVQFLPVMETLLIQAWRRQMVAAISRSGALASAGGAETLHGQYTVGFADLVGFTRISRQLPEARLAGMVEMFDSVSADVVAYTGARLVKTLGDEVLFVADNAAIAAETALRLHDAHAASEDVPRLRIGMATGAVITRMGDLFGTTVNRASRLTATAKPRGTLIDTATHEALAADSRYALRGVRPRTVRGLGLIRTWSLSRKKGKKGRG